MAIQGDLGVLGACSEGCYTGHTRALVERAWAKLKTNSSTQESCGEPKVSFASFPLPLGSCSFHCYLARVVCIRCIGLVMVTGAGFASKPCKYPNSSARPCRSAIRTSSSQLYNRSSFQNFTFRGRLHQCEGCYPHWCAVSSRIPNIVVVVSFLDASNHTSLTTSTVGLVHTFFKYGLTAEVYETDTFCFFVGHTKLTETKNGS